MKALVRTSLALTFSVATIVNAQTVTGTGSSPQVTFWTGVPGTSTVSGDPALTWNSTNNKLAVSSVAPAAKLQAMFDSSSALFETGGQGRGTLARVFAVGDGSLAAPISTVNPTFVVQRVDATSDAGAYIPFEFAVEKPSGTGFMYALHSYVHVTSPTLTDAVATTGSIVMEPTSTPGATQTGFGMWGRAERYATGTRIASVEFDCINSSGSDAPAPFAGDVNNITLGVQIVGAGNAKNSMALEIAAVGGQWWSGIVFDPGSIANFGYAIDLSKVGVSATPIRLGNNTYMQARNAADTADIKLLGLGGDNTLRLGADDILVGTNFLISPGAPFGTKNVAIGTTAPTADSALEVNGGTTKGLRLTPRTTAGAPVGGTWSKGTLVVDSNGVLWIRLAASWQKVGAQL